MSILVQSKSLAPSMMLSSSVPRSNFTSLPMDPIYSIFSFLNEMDFASTRVVCRAFQPFSWKVWLEESLTFNYDLWRKYIHRDIALAESSSSSEEQVIYHQIKSSSTYLQELDLREGNDDEISLDSLYSILPTDINSFPCLKKLRLILPEFSILDSQQPAKLVKLSSVLSSIPLACPNLISLNLATQCRSALELCKSLIKSCKKLTELTLTIFAGDIDQEWVDIFNQHSNLTSISLKLDFGYSPQLVPQILALTSLKIGITEVNYDKRIEVLKSCKTLTRLEINGGGHRIPKTLINEIASHLPQIHHLSLGHIYTPLDSEAFALFPYLEKLELLYVTLNDSVLKAIANIPRLRELNFEPKLGGQKSRVNFKMLNLKTLRLRGSNRLHELDALLVNLAECPSLRELDLRDGVFLSKDKLASIKAFESQTKIVVRYHE